MKVRNLLLLGATGMAATAVTVWMTMDPAHAAISKPLAIAPAPAPTPAPPVVPIADNSHFQTGKTLMM